MCVPFGVHRYPSEHRCSQVSRTSIQRTTEYFHKMCSVFGEKRASCVCIKKQLYTLLHTFFSSMRDVGGLLHTQKQRNIIYCNIVLKIIIYLIRHAVYCATSMTSPSRVLGENCILKRPFKDMIFWTPLFSIWKTHSKRLEFAEMAARRKTLHVKKGLRFILYRSSLSQADSLLLFLSARLLQRLKTRIPFPNTVKQVV